MAGERSNYAMSGPDFAPSRGEVWYTDGNSGFYDVRLDKGVWPFPAGSGAPKPGACLRPSRVPFKLHRVKGTRIVGVTAYVNGKRRLRRRGHDIKRVVLGRLPRGRHLKVRIVATHSTGAKVVSVRTWNGCKKGKPRLRLIRRP